MKEPTVVFFLLTLVLPLAASVHMNKIDAPFSVDVPSTVMESRSEDVLQSHPITPAVGTKKLAIPDYLNKEAVTEFETDQMENGQKQDPEEEMDDGIEAFVTCVQTAEDVIDACVLARSIRSHFGVSRDMIAIVLGSKGEHGSRLSLDDRQKNWKTLEKCGWEVMKFSLPPNEYILRKRRLEWLRIHSWALTEYRAVVYIEPSSLIISPSVQELFRCGCFCASIYKGDYFEPDVMGLRPDASVYEHMLSTLEANTLGKRPQLIPWFNTYFKDLLMKPYFPLKVPAETVRCFSCRVEYFSTCMRRLPVGFNADPISHGIFLNSRLLRFKFSSLKPYKWWSAMFLSSHSRKMYLHYKRQTKHIASFHRSFGLLCFFRVLVVAIICSAVKKHRKRILSKCSSIFQWKNTALLQLVLSYLFGPVVLYACIISSWLLVPQHCDYVTGFICFNALLVLLYFSASDLVAHIYTAASVGCFEEKAIYDTDYWFGNTLPYIQPEEKSLRLWLFKLRILLTTAFCIIPPIFIRFTRNINVLVSLFLVYLLLLSMLSQLFLFLRFKQLVAHKMASILFDHPKEPCFGPQVMTSHVKRIMADPRYFWKQLRRYKGCLKL